MHNNAITALNWYKPQIADNLSAVVTLYGSYQKHLHFDVIITLMYQ